MAKTRVGCVFPGAALSASLVRLGATKLASVGIELRFYRTCPSGEGLAGSDAERLREMELALNDPDISSVLFARGGYGASRILPHLRETAVANCRRLFGYSDLTCILNDPTLCGKVSMYHSPMLIDVAHGLSDPDLAELASCLSQPHGRSVAEDLVLHGTTGIVGSAAGPLVGGNLTSLLSTIGTPSEPNFDNAVLLIEDVGEFVYRFDRAMAQLADCGVLDRVSAVVCGNFTDFSEGTIHLGVSAEQIVLYWMSGRKKPVVTGLPLGHGFRKATIELGQRYRVDVYGKSAQLRRELQTRTS